MEGIRIRGCRWLLPIHNIGYVNIIKALLPSAIVECCGTHIYKSAVLFLKLADTVLRLHKQLSCLFTFVWTSQKTYSFCTCTELQADEIRKLNFIFLRLRFRDGKNQNVR